MHDKCRIFYCSILLCADHSGCAVYGINCLLPLEHWGHGFESHSRHGCLRAFILCVGISLVTGWFPIQGVLQTVYRIKKLKKWPRPKGLYSHREYYYVGAIHRLSSLKLLSFGNWFHLCHQVNRISEKTYCADSSVHLLSNHVHQIFKGHVYMPIYNEDG
jgi:hypothetical protein